MKKKQLFAVLLAGSMTVGMAPAAAFAAEDTSTEAAADAQTAEDNTEAADGAATDAQEPADTPAETDTTQTDADNQADADAQAAAAQAAADAQAQTETDAAAQAAATEQQVQEAGEKEADATVSSAEELQNAINRAPDFTGTIDDENLDDTAYNILISGAFNLTDTIKIPTKKNIAIYGVEITIGRGTAAGDMFEVGEGSVLSLTQNEAGNSTAVCKLALDGKKTDGTAAEGSIVSVKAGAKFVMTTGVTLANNTTSVSGAAIRNSGKTVITGGEIKGNVSADGAVYNTGILSLGKDEKAAADEPKISENYTADQSAKSNIVLDTDEQGNKGQIVVASAVSGIGYSVKNPEADYTVFQKADKVVGTDFNLADVIGTMSYEGDANYKVDASTGKLVSNRPTVTVNSTEWKNDTEGSAVVNTDKDGTLYYTCVAKGAEAPAFDASKLNKVENVKAGDNTIKLTGLSGTEMDLYVWVVTAENFVGQSEKKTITLNKDPDKPAAPNVTAKFSKWNSASEAVITIHSDKKGQYYYKVVKKGANAPSIDTSKAGKAIEANKDTSVKLSNLKEGTSYEAYICVKAEDGSVSKLTKIELSQSGRPTSQTKASVSWKSYKWRDHSSATVTFIIGADGICNYTWKVKGSKENGGSGKVTIKADKAFNIELNNLPDKEIEVYISAKDSKGKDILLQATINNKVSTKTSFKISLPEKTRPAVPTPTPTDTPDAKIPDVTESVLHGLDGALEFYPGKFYDFSVTGAGTDNENPNEGDVKWVPLYWSTSANPSEKNKHTSWRIGLSTGKKAITEEKTINLYVFFKKWIYTNGQWVETDTIESAPYQFHTAKLIKQADGTYVAANGENDPDVTGEASATSSNGGNGTTSRSAASTADNSPIGTMSALAVASLLAGGYVIVRRRKKDI